MLPRSVPGIAVGRAWGGEESFWDVLPKAFLLRPKQHSELQVILAFSKTLELPVCFPRALQSH